MMFVQNLDSQLTLFLYGVIPHQIVTNYFFSFFSQQGFSILIWAIILCLLLLFEETHDKRSIVYCGIAFLLAIFLTTGIKNVIQRPRPYTTLPVVNIACPVDYSFPSGHAATAFAVAVVLAYFDKKRKYLYYAVAGLIALSRIYLGCHYAGDVIAGTIIGIIIGLSILKLRISKK